MLLVMESTTTTLYNNITISAPTISHADHIYAILTTVASVLSILGGLCICALYFRWKDMRTPVRQLLLFLAISDTFLAFGNFLGVLWFLYRDSKLIDNSRGFCVFQSALTIYFSFTSFFWTVIMALSMFLTVVLGMSTFTATYMKLFHVIGWTLPGIILIVALSLDVLGTDTSLQQPSWCWIDPRTDNPLFWQFMAAKFWEILAYFTTVVLYTPVKIFLRRQAVRSKELVHRKRSKGDVFMEANRKLTFVPLVFIVCRIWGTLRFLLGNFEKDHINEPYVTWINPLQGIGDSIQGFANFIIYCYSLRRVRRRIGRCLCPALFSAHAAHTEAEAHTRALKQSKVDVMRQESHNEIGNQHIRY